MFRDDFLVDSVSRTPAFRILRIAQFPIKLSLKPPAPTPSYGGQKGTRQSFWVGEGRVMVRNRLLRVLGTIFGRWQKNPDSWKIQAYLKNPKR